MYSGIVKGVLPIVGLEDADGLRSIVLSFSDALRANLEIGASVAVDGVCLTVTRMAGNEVSFDAMKETLEKTTLGLLKLGGKVNVERSARQGDEIGGHILSGHVEGMAEIVEIQSLPNNHVVSFRFPAEWSAYLFNKGFVAVNGASLTVSRPGKENVFSVFFIPETLRATTFLDKKVGDRVNIEIDHQTKVIVDTVRNFLQGNDALLSQATAKKQ